MSELYYGPPDADNYCAYDYNARRARPVRGYRCPNHVAFYVKVPDGRGDDWRKAWASCIEHLPEIIWQMIVAYRYRGEFLLRAEVMMQ